MLRSFHRQAAQQAAGALAERWARAAGPEPGHPVRPQGKRPVFMLSHHQGLHAHRHHHDSTLVARVRIPMARPDCPISSITQPAEDLKVVVVAAATAVCLLRRRLRRRLPRPSVVFVVIVVVVEEEEG